MTRRTLLSALCLLILALPAAAGAQGDSHNDRYVDPDLDLQRMIDTFESETREVYAQRQLIVDHLALAPGSTVADVGAGTGAFLEPLLAAIGEEGHLFAVDISPRFVEHLRDQAREGGHDNVTAVLNAHDSVTLPEASVDVVFLCDTYHHFDDPAAMLASIHRALRPGGHLAVVDFDRVEGVSRQWILDHVRASKEVFLGEIEAAGFELIEEVEAEELVDNFFLRLRRR